MSKFRSAPLEGNSLSPGIMSMSKFGTAAQFSFLPIQLSIAILSSMYFQITNPYRAAFGITNPDLHQALVERAQTTLQHVVGARAVHSVVTEHEAITFEIAEMVGDSS